MIKARTLAIAGLVASTLACLPVTKARASLLDSRPKEMSFRLDGPDAPRFSLLLPFRDASIERLGPLRLYTTSTWGSWINQPWMRLSWDQKALGSTVTVASDADLDPQIESEALADPFAAVNRLGLDDDLASPLDPFAFQEERELRRRVDSFEKPRFESTSTLRSNGFDVIFRLPPVKPVVDWRCRRKPVQFMRYGAENDSFELVRCDGTTAPDALDRLSILARPPEAARPDGGLPAEPDAAAWKDKREWVDGVRVVHPRLLWALQRVADAFPRKAVYIFSGYRPFAEVNDGTGHKSLHASGRAIDISIVHVPNEQLFSLCRELKDVGCGFYPHGKFVHIDVRRAGSGKAFWIDASEPGEPAQYVDSWPGVVDSGGLSWSATLPH